MIKIHKKYRTSKINIPKKFSFEENLNNLYFGDYYIKDFRYLNPETFNRKRCQDNFGNVKQQSNKPLLLERWLDQVLRGVKQFFYGGSLHGVKYIFEPSFSAKEKMTWIVIMVISIAICAVNIIQLFSKWTSTPFVNVIDSVPTPIWAIPFPTVVICPHIHVKISFAKVSKLSGVEKFFASLVCPRMSDVYTDEKLTPHQIEKLQEFIVKGSMKCDDVVKSCNWPVKHGDKWQTRNCCDLFQPIFTNYGLCFAFNSVPLNGMTNNTFPWQMTFNTQSKPTSLSWGLDIGYPKVFPPDLTKLPYRVMASGETNGLGVELYLNTSEHQYECDGNSLGFTILISSPTDHAYTSTVLRLPMDRMTTIEVSPLTYKTDSSLRSLPPYQRQCFFQNEKRLDYYDFYTDSNCQHDLLIQEARRMCDCVLFNWPRKNVLEPVCSTKQDFNCINEVNSKVEELLIYAYYEESDEQSDAKEESKSCHPSCNDIIYSSEVFYSDLIRDPRKGELQWGKPGLGEVTEINVHFYKNMFLGQHRHAQYDDYYFAGAVGGLLSLFLGFSIISVAEIVYFIILRPIYVVLKKTY